jgi:hypothetical protein
MKPVKKLDRSGLLALVTFFMSGGTKSDEEDVECLLTISANCPDPPEAMELLVGEKKDSGDDVETPEGFIDRAMEMPVRSAESYSTKELHPNHPLRKIRFK